MDPFSIPTAVGEDLGLIKGASAPNAHQVRFSDLDLNNGFPYGFPPYFDLIRNLSTLRKRLMDIIALEKIYVRQLMRISEFMKELTIKPVTSFETVKGDREHRARMSMTKELRELAPQLELARIKMKEMEGQTQHTGPTPGYTTLVSNLEKVSTKEETIRDQSSKCFMELAKCSFRAEGKQKEIWEKADQNYFWIRSKWEYLKAEKGKIQNELNQYQLELESRINEANSNSNTTTT